MHFLCCNVVWPQDWLRYFFPFLLDCVLVCPHMEWCDVIEFLESYCNWMCVLSIWPAPSLSYLILFITQSRPSLSITFFLLYPLLFCLPCYCIYSNHICNPLFLFSYPSLLFNLSLIFPYTSPSPSLSSFPSILLPLPPSPHFLLYFSLSLTLLFSLEPILNWWRCFRIRDLQHSQWIAYPVYCPGVKPSMLYLHRSVQTYISPVIYLFMLLV